MARLIVATAAAAVVGYFTGGAGALQTFTLVYGATGFLDPNKKLLGPKLNDLKAPQANYGAVIPYLEGAPRLAGCYIWASDKREIASTSSEGKGGPGVDSTTFTYEMDVLIEFAINECAGWRRIFVNGRLAASKAADADAETLEASASGKYWRDVRFYNGNASQLPDPTYEAAVGVGNAPAYRTRTTMLFEGLNLGGSGQLPIITVEIISEGVVTYVGPYTLVRADFQDVDPTLDSSWFGSPAIEVGSPIYEARGEIGDIAWVSNGLGVQNYVKWTGAQLAGLNRAFTMEAFVGYRTLTNNSAFIMAFVASGVHFSAYWYGATGKIGVSQTTGPSPAILSTTVLEADTVVHIAVVMPAGTPAVARLYLRGILEGELAIDNGNYAGGDFRVGDEDISALHDIYVTGAKLTLGEVYTGASFDPPSELPPADDPIELIAPIDVTLDQVVRRLCLRTGHLEDGDIDVTDLEDDIVRAMAISQVSSSRQGLETLATAYLFEAVEGEALKFVKRGGSSVWTIPYQDLGASAEGTAEPLPKKLRNDMEQPARVSVKYANVLNDFQDGLESADRLTTESTAEVLVELTLGFTPAEAKKLADANTMDLAVGRLQLGPLALSRKYAALEPTDPITVTDADGSTFRVRIAKGTISNGVNLFEVSLDDATVVNSAALTDEDYASSTLIRSLSDTDLEILDAPILRAADDDLGPYVAVAAGPRWGAARIDKSSDNINFSPELTISSKTAMGLSSTLLGDFSGGWVFDELNSVTVDVRDSVLSSFSRSSVLEGTAAAYLVGEEILIPQLATFVSPGVYRLSSMLRGQRGTEWAIGGHTTNERIVLLQTSGLRKVHDVSADLNAVRYYRATTIGKTPAEGGEAFTDTGIALKPFAPVDLQVSTAADGSQLLSWHRRSRTSFGGLGDVPLGEASEEYEIDVLDPFDALVGSLTSTTDSVALSGWLEGLETSAFIFAFQSGGYIYGVSDNSSSTISLHKIDAATGLSVGGVGTPGGAYAIYATALLGVGSNIYLSYINGASPSRVVKYDTATFTPAATYTAPAAADTQGMCYDGTNIWVSASYSGSIKKLDASTLAVVATYAIGAVSTLFYDAGSGHIFAALRGPSSSILEVDPATGGVVQTIPCRPFPADLFVSGPSLFVAAASAAELIDIATQVQLNSFAFGTDSIRNVFADAGGGLVAMADGIGTVSILDSSGLVEALIAGPWHMGGAVTGGLLLNTVTRLSPLITKGNIYVEADLTTGYTANVYQISAVVGRGYPGSISF